MASSGDGAPGRWVFTGALGLWLALMLIAHLFSSPFAVIIFLFLLVVTAIVWFVDSIFLDSQLGDRLHRWGNARNRAKRPTPWTPMAQSFQEMDGAPDWSQLRKGS